LKGIGGLASRGFQQRHIRHHFKSTQNAILAFKAGLLQADYPDSFRRLQA
jgi:hypothetical protein